MTDERETLSVVSEMIEDILGESWMEDREVTMETSFGSDLELESIELVVLAEKLQDRYGEEVDFVEWLSEKELEEIIELRVGDLVEFIDSCR